jgi:hypothetical protein
VIIDPNRDYAVVTGDIVASSQLAADVRAELPALIGRCSDELREAWGAAVPLDVVVYRGDAWQMLVARPEQAVLASLHFRTGLQSALDATRLDTRAAIAVAPVDFIGEGGLATGDGPAFRLSGNLLEQLGRKASLGLAAPDLASEECLQTVLRLVDHLATNWSGRQARAVRGALRGWTQEEIAHRCWDEPVSQQTVAQHLDRAGWRAVHGALDFVGAVLARESRSGSGPAD